MIDKILRAKHWQLFILMFGLIIFGQIIVFFSIFGFLAYHEEPNMKVFIYSTIPLVVISLISMIVTFSWNWAVGIGLQSKVPEEAKMKTGWFKFFFFYPLGYIFLFMGAMIVMMLTISDSQPEPPLFLFGSFILIIPLHFLAMFAMFYCLYFIAKTFKTVELQKKVDFSDFAGEFFLIWFFFIGVWIIQPKINKIMERKELDGK